MFEPEWIVADVARIVHGLLLFVGLEKACIGMCPCIHDGHIPMVCLSTARSSIATIHHPSLICDRPSGHTSANISALLNTDTL